MNYRYLGSIFRGAPHWGDNRIAPYFHLGEVRGGERGRAEGEAVAAAVRLGEPARVDRGAAVGAGADLLAATGGGVIQTRLIIFL